MIRSHKNLSTHQLILHFKIHGARDMIRLPPKRYQHSGVHKSNFKPHCHFLVKVVMCFESEGKNSSHLRQSVLYRIVNLGIAKISFKQSILATCLERSDQ